MTSSLEIKICGLSTRESIDAAIRGGATHIGMIFFEKSPRHVSLELAKMLSQHAGNMVQKVAVTVNASDHELAEIVKYMAPDMIQLHGSETPQRAALIAERYNLRTIKALSIETKTDLKKISAYRGVVSRILFDAKPPKGSDLPGGNGVSFDWNMLRECKHLKNHDGFDAPYMLSGGLDEENIIEALAVSNAQAVDLSSGVESAPGIKDIDKIKDFLAKITIETKVK